MRCFHCLTPHVLALRNRIEYAVPSASGIEDRHVEHEHRVVPTALPLKEFPWPRDVGFFEVCGFHLCVSFQW